MDNAAAEEARPIIVVAEDSAPNRKILVTLLTRMGFYVEETANGEDAWNFVSNCPAGQIVLIVTDFMMPKLDGIQLIEKVRSHEPYKSVPILISSAISDKDVIMKAKALNVTGYLLKPIRSDTLFKKMMELFPRHKGLATFKANLRAI